MYFNNFPKIYYDFPVKENQDNSLFILTDITNNVRIRKEVLENVTLYDEYDILDGETPEMIAEKIYGNAEYHWIIMLVNQRYDYLRDFPMSVNELYEYVDDTYGEEGKNDVHHYERGGVIVEGVATMKIPAAAHAQIKVHDFIFTGKANARVEAISYQFSASNIVYENKLKTYTSVKVYDEPLSTRTINDYLGTATLYSLSNGIIILGNLDIPQGKSAADIKSVFTESSEFQCNVNISTGTQPIVSVLVDYGRFTAGEAVNVQGFRVNAEGSYEYSNITNFTIPQSGGFVLNDNYIPITNYEYELAVNESKRRIKIISPQLVTQIVDEFTQLITP